MTAPKHPPSVFRSEEMVLCQFFIQDEVAFACIEALGHIEAVQFRDVNLGVPPRERPYFAELEILNHAQEILHYLEREIKKKGLVIAPEDDDIPTPIPGDLLDIKDTLERFSSEVRDVDKYIQSLKKRYEETIEITTVLNLAKKYLKTAFEEIQREETPVFGTDDIEAGARHAHEMKTMKINFIGGVVRRERFSAFEQTLWRASRAKVFVKFEHIDHEFHASDNDQPVLKTGFMAFFQGEILSELSTKIAEGFRAKLYLIPEETDVYDDALEKTDAQRHDLETIVDITEKHYEELLHICAENLENWYTQVIKMKAVYTALNNFPIKPHVGEGWVAIQKLSDTRDSLTKVAKEAGGLSDPVITIIDCDEEPPTYFWNDKFTKGFQTLIDSYGMATYKEVNPMPYTVISFPFLFSMMFGDLGHGALLFALGLVMIIREKQMIAEKSKNEIRNIMFGGRYIITLMGIFSIYSGFIYNDCFAASLNIFGSRWSVSKDFNDIRTKDFIGLDPATDYIGTPYPFGIDPVWDTSQNKIIFLNSFKMKISIIFGVLQMIFGLILSFWNDWYFGQYGNLLCMFIPQMIWMCALFGWLCFLMIFKWIMFGANMPYERGTTCAPSVLIHFIGMILHKAVEHPEGCLEEMFSNQKIIQEVLFVSAIICVPWLCFMKPLIIFNIQAKKERKIRRIKTKHYKHKKHYAKKDLWVKGEDEDEDEDKNVEHNIKEEYEDLQQTYDKKDKDKAIDEELLVQKEKVEEEQLEKDRGQKEKYQEQQQKERDQEDEESYYEEDVVHKKSVTLHPKQEQLEKKKERDRQENKCEFMIHQGILTIEYVLGTISHTASYLRLWALSLAHAQLSRVLWNMVLAKTIGLSLHVPYAGFLLIFLGWMVWAVLTIAILVLMEGLSAFLHTLRLHWVEFNSKFYTGLGYEFAPFSFRKILSAERDG